MRRAQRFARNRLTDAASAFAVLHVAFELTLEGIKPVKQHLGRMPANGAIGGIANYLRLFPNASKRIGRSVEIQHILEQRRQPGNSLAARHAFPARLATACAKQVKLKRNCAHARWGCPYSAFIFVQKRAELAIVFGARRNRQFCHASPFICIGPMPRRPRAAPIAASARSGTQPRATFSKGGIERLPLRHGDPVRYGSRVATAGGNGSRHSDARPNLFNKSPLIEPEVPARPAGAIDAAPPKEPRSCAQPHTPHALHRESRQPSCSRPPCKRPCR